MLTTVILLYGNFLLWLPDLQNTHHEPGLEWRYYNSSHRRYRGVFKLFTAGGSQDLGIDDLPFREKEMVHAVIGCNECVGYDDVQVADPTKRGIYPLPE